MSGGTLGIIIPPSIPMIIYGLVTETSVTDLFAAGFGPGMLLTGRAVGLRDLRQPAHQIRRSSTAPTCWWRCARASGRLMMPVILLGGIYSGYFTATEAAAVALVYAMAGRDLHSPRVEARDFYGVVLDASKLGGSLFPVLAVALSLNIVLTEHRVPAMMVEFMQGYIDSPLMFMLMVNVLLLIVGCLMTTGEAILILAPLLAPLAEAYGFDKVAVRHHHDPEPRDRLPHAPGGLNLLVAMSTFKQKFAELVVAATPFIVLMLACLALISWQPWIAMSLVR
jgi:C4-dicarboxylate transporter DctM subunit